MPAEGMVHALEICWELLALDGCIIDIHPTGEPPPIEAHSAGQIYPLGHIQEIDGFVEYGQATAALSNCVERGLYVRESQDKFDFITRAASLDELREYLSATWSDAIIPEEVEAQMELIGLSQTEKWAADCEIWLREPISISRLNKHPFPNIS